MDLFRKSGSYRFMDAFILANVVELGTCHFCDRFLNLKNDPGGRTYSQMTHAARSGCRNFSEGSERLKTSYSTAIKLLDVARASLCELRDDYNKWLMLKWQAPWAVDSKEAQWVFNVRLDSPDYGNDINRGVCLHVLAQFKKFERGLLSDDAIIRANTLLVIIARTLHMQEKYIESLGNEFKEQGGFRERMSTVRSEARAEKGTPNEGPACPKCGAVTHLRKTRKDNRPFWGCSEYPACRGIIDYKA